MGMTRGSFVNTQLIDKLTAVPVEGQVAHSYAVVAAGSVSSRTEIQIVPGGAALTIDNTLASSSAFYAKNLIGRRIVFKCNAPAASTTLTLTSSTFNQGSTVAATFSSSLESSLELAFTDLAGVLVVNVISSRNVTFA